MSDDGAAKNIVNLAEWIEARPQPEDKGGGGGGGEPPSGLPPGEVPEPMWASDDFMAVRLVDEVVPDWKHVASWAQWLHWDGRHWLPETTLAMWNYAREICRRVRRATEATPATLRGFESAKTIAAAVSLARSDRRVACPAEDYWDADDHLLNCPGGIVDLNTGILSPSDRGRYMMHLAGATPEGDCPHWKRFIHEVTRGDQAYIDFLQRLSGYSLRGDTSEEKFVFLHGPSRTGKTKFVETLTELHGSYADAAPMSTFLSTTAERHPTDLAGFAGKRLVTAAETEGGRRWDRQRLTMLTGRDRIKARFMRGDFFFYYPKFLLMFHGNYRPRLDGADEAMLARMLLLPFRFRPERLDPHLIEKFRAELGGIMLWAVEGAEIWRRHGLLPPPVVRSATEAYFAGENSIQNWIEEKCDRGPNLTSLTRELYRDFSLGIKEANEFLMSEKRFAETLDMILGEDCRWRQPGTGRQGFRGLALKRRNQELPF